MKEVVVQKKFVYNIPLQPLQEGTKMILKNIQFESGKHELLPESFIELDKLLAILNENPRLKVLIVGHTDNIGNDNENLLLSNQRAKIVLNYFTSKGIAVERLTSKGMGAQQPVSDNQTEEGRALNRRTEMIILSTQ
jgi:outer membrane protein OmpA-like peptidoglycan-associated protein